MMIVVAVAARMANVGGGSDVQAQFTRFHFRSSLSFFDSKWGRWERKKERIGRERSPRTVTSTTQTLDLDIDFTFLCIHVECIVNVRQRTDIRTNTNAQDLLLVNRLRFVALLMICFSCICLGLTVYIVYTPVASLARRLFRSFLLRSQLASSAVCWKFTALSSLSAYCPTQIHKESNLLAVSTRTCTHTRTHIQPKNGNFTKSWCMTVIFISNNLYLFKWNWRLAPIKAFLPFCRVLHSPPHWMGQNHLCHLHFILLLISNVNLGRQWRRWRRRRYPGKESEKRTEERERERERNAQCHCRWNEYKCTHTRRQILCARIWLISWRNK